MNIRHALAMIAAACLAAPAQAKAPSCNETCLLDLATSYIDGLGAADPSGVPLAKDFVQWENGVPTSTTRASGRPATGGLTGTPGRSGYRRDGNLRRRA